MSGTKTPADQPTTALFRLHAQQVEKLPPCQAQCPNSGDIRGWMGVIAQHEKNGLTLNQAYDRAWEMIADLNPLLATVSRICPHPCEDLCTRADKDGAVSINAIERFLGDWGLSRSLPLPRADAEKHPESTDVINQSRREVRDTVAELQLQTRRMVQELTDEVADDERVKANEQASQAAGTSEPATLDDGVVDLSTLEPEVVKRLRALRRLGNDDKSDAQLIQQIRAGTQRSRSKSGKKSKKAWWSA